MNGVAGKVARTGKQYACQHCSYSADKKVSLNRHMRMHSSSPGPSPTTTSMPNGGQVPGTPPAEVAAALLNSPHLVDRYCQDCDIRFSSVKTFRAHKLHYCSTRHVVKSQPAQSQPSAKTSSESAPESPLDATSRTSPSSSPPNKDRPQQTLLALPTNPILLVPCSLLQGASVLNPAVANMKIPAPDTACLLLPNGTLHPMAQAVHSFVTTSKELDVARAAVEQVIFQFNLSYQRK